MKNQTKSAFLVFDFAKRNKSEIYFMSARIQSKPIKSNEIKSEQVLAILSKAIKVLYVSLHFILALKNYSKQSSVRQSARPISLP